MAVEVVDFYRSYEPPAGVRPTVEAVLARLPARYRQDVVPGARKEKGHEYGASRSTAAMRLDREWLKKQDPQLRQST